MRMLIFSFGKVDPNAILESLNYKTIFKLFSIRLLGGIVLVKYIDHTWPHDFFLFEISQTMGCHRITSKHLFSKKLRLGFGRSWHIWYVKRWELTTRICFAMSCSSTGANPGRRTSSRIFPSVLKPIFWNEICTIFEWISFGQGNTFPCSIRHIFMFLDSICYWDHFLWRW